MQPQAPPLHPTPALLLLLLPSLLYQVLYYACR
jgi:hypothetical protein